jgi:hypothetical protein
LTFTPKLTTTLTAISLGLAAPAIAQQSDTAAPEDLQGARENAKEARDSMGTTQGGTEERVEDLQNARPDAQQARDSLDETQQGNPGDVALTADNVTDGQVDAFVKAAIAVEEVRGIYLPDIQNAETQQEREALMAEANTAAMQAVEDVQGVTPREYLAIARLAQSDQTLTDRINVELRAMRVR